MIVQPNFFDHHKTRQLVIELGGDELAPLYVLRLWAHCQNQKKWRFQGMSAGALFAICGANVAKTSPQELWLAMQSAGFVRVKNKVLSVHEWEHYNASLVKNWENGKKGGRPKKPSGNPNAKRVNPAETQTRNGVTDREDKIEKKNTPLPPAAADFEADSTEPRSRQTYPPALAASPEFVRCWEQEWLPYLTQRKDGRMPAIMTVERHLGTCLRLGPAKAVLALRSAIEKEWAAPDENPRQPAQGASRGNGIDPDQEPEGWKAYWRETYPPEDCPDAPRYEDGMWMEIRRDHRREIWQALLRKNHGKVAVA